MAISPDLIFVEGAAVCACVAAVTDLRSRRIPNWLTGFGIVFGLVLHLVVGDARDAGLALIAGLATGGVFFLFFVAGGMGAGDVKLMAAVGCLGGLASVPGILVATVILGAVAAMFTALAGGRLRETLANTRTLVAHHQANGLASHPDFNVRNGGMLRLPYALPIAGGCLLTLMLRLHGVPAL